MPDFAAIQARAHRAPRLTLVLFCLLAWLPGFFTLPPMDRDESRFAQATKQMIETGDFIRIRYATVARNAKPVGIYWAQIPFVLAARGAGLALKNPIWPYRLPSLLGGLIAVLATFEMGLALGRDRAAALLAAAMLGGCALLVSEAHTAKTDAALLAATTLCMGVLARAWMGRAVTRGNAALFWVALGAGILLKGPITPMVVGLTLLSLGVRGRRWDWLRGLRPGWGVPLLLALVLPWFIAIGVETHGQFFREAVGGDLGQKLAGGKESHGGFWGEHALLLPLLSFPFGFLVLGALPAAWRDRTQSAEKFLLAWIIPAWLVFEWVPTKLPHYVLPLYPALFLLAAPWVTAAARGKTPLWWRRLMWALFVLAGIVLAVGAVYLPIKLHGPWWLGVPAGLAALSCVWFGGVVARPALALAGGLLFYASLLGLELPNLSPLWLGPRTMAAVRQFCPEIPVSGAGLDEAGYAEPSLQFLGGTRMLWLTEGRLAVPEFEKSGATCLIVAESEVPHYVFELGHHGIGMHRLAEISGFNYSRGQPVTLVLMSPYQLRAPYNPPPGRR